MGPHAVRAVRGGAGPAVPRAGGPDRRCRACPGGRPGLRCRRADRDAGRALAGGLGAGCGLVGGDDRATAAPGKSDGCPSWPSGSEWTPAGPVDVLVCNAALQWVPGHLAAAPPGAELAPAGWLAFQVPGNFGAPSHRRCARWRARRGGRPGVARPCARRRPVAERYSAELAGLGCRVDAWETTYLHVLTGRRAGARAGCAAPGCGRCWPGWGRGGGRVRAELGAMRGRLPGAAVRDGASVPADLRGAPGSGRDRRAAPRAAPSPAGPRRRCGRSTATAGHGRGAKPAALAARGGVWFRRVR